MTRLTTLYHIRPDDALFSHSFPWHDSSWHRREEIIKPKFALFIDFDVKLKSICINWHYLGRARQKEMDSKLIDLLAPQRSY
jgi:hypothetical protein